MEEVLHNPPSQREVKSPKRRGRRKPVEHNDEVRSTDPAIALLQFQVQLLDKNQGEITNTLKSVVASIDSMQKESIKREDALVESLGKKIDSIRDGNKTNWSTWLTAAGIFLVIIGMIGGILWYPIKQNQSFHDDRIIKLEMASRDYVTVRERDAIESEKSKYRQYVIDNFEKRLNKLEETNKK